MEFILRKDRKGQNMRLQIAIDVNDTYTALKVLEQVYPYLDIAELGTPLMIAEGARAVRAIKKEYPDVKVLSDIKLMDGGGPIAKIVLAAGADIVTVLGAANEQTISGVAAAAKEYGKAVFVDLISVADVKSRAAQIDKLGVDYIGVHTSYDLRESVATPLEDLKKIKEVVTSAKTSISGGIKPEMLNDIIPICPDVIIVGGSILTAKNQAESARFFYNKIHNL